MGAVSPDLEKQGIFAVVFVNREYSGQPVRRGGERPKKRNSTSKTQIPKLWKQKNPLISERILYI